jgi:hypothetical protein
MLNFKEYMGLFGFTTVGNTYNSEEYNEKGTNSKLVSPEGKKTKSDLNVEKLFFGKKIKKNINK